jgi:hypothetical protein
MLSISLGETTCDNNNSIIREAKNNGKPLREGLA